MSMLGDTSPLCLRRSVNITFIIEEASQKEASFLFHTHSVDVLDIFLIEWLESGEDSSEYGFLRHDLEVCLINTHFWERTFQLQLVEEEIA